MAIPGRLAMDPAYIAAHLEEDEEHWWFLGRRAVLRSVLRAAFRGEGLRLAEIGCGGGSLLRTAGEVGEVVGIESDPEFLRAARERGFPVLSGALPDRLPLPEESCDGVLLFDVLEHIEDDRAALRAAARLLKPGGLVVATVPAYPWLWSAHDVVLGHRRRYTRAGLRRLAREAGLLPVRSSYFNTVLAPAVVGVRLVRRWRGASGHDLRRPARPVNRLLAWLFAVEAGLLRWADLPFGISILLVARREGARRRGRA